MPEPGERIDSFILEEAIGVGGMGAVYRAHDETLDRQVALKLLPPEQSHDIEAVQRFYQEARAAARLDHENIAGVYAIGHDNNYHYISFEYIEGTTVRQRVIENGPLPVSDVVNYSLQIAGALTHASQRGVVHRDIKPSNIIVTSQGRAKLVDMGLARRFEREGKGVEDGLTQSGVTLGTFDYISPEQARDPRSVDVRSDLYSLGCTMYHMLTGGPPFPNGNVLQKLIQQQEEPAPNVRESNPEVPSELANIVLKLMKKDRERRYQNPDQLVRDLMNLAGALGLRSVSPEGLVWLSGVGPARWEHHLVWAVPILFLGLVVSYFVWLGQEASTDGIGDVHAVATRPTGGGKAVPGGAGGKAVAAPAIPTEKAGPGTIPAFVSEASSEHRVTAEEGLSPLLENAPSGSTLTLVDAGPYDLKLVPASTSKEVSEKLRDRVLTVRAAAGVHPVIRMVRNTNGKAPSSSGEGTLLLMRGGRWILEGLEFRVEPAEHDGPVRAIVAEDTDLRISRCMFRLVGSGGSQGAAVLLRGKDQQTTGSRPAPFVMSQSHLDGGQVGLLVQGGADVYLRDCTFGPSNPAIWLEGKGRREPAPVRLRMEHVSIIAGSGPVFKFSGTGAIVRMDDSVVAPPPGAVEGTLAATDQAALLDWLGRDNLYSRIGVYLLPTRDPAREVPLRSFDEWVNVGATVREIFSKDIEGVVWRRPDPLHLIRSGADPLLAFEVSQTGSGAPGAGAISGPDGEQESGGDILPGDAPASSVSLVDTADPRPGAAGEGSKAASLPGADVVATVPTVPRTAEDTSPAPADRNELAPMVRATSGDISAESDQASLAEGGAADNNPRDIAEQGPSGPKSSTAAVSEEVGPEVVVEGGGAGESEVSTSSKLRELLTRPSAGTTPIRLAAGADIEVTSGLLLQGKERWVLTGSEGAKNQRPRLRFRPETAGEEVTRWVSLFTLAAGGRLELREVDLVVEGGSISTTGKIAVLALDRDAEAALEDCTVTVAEAGARTAVVVQADRDPKPANGGAVGLTAPGLDQGSRVRIADCFLRVSQDALDLGSSESMTIQVRNTVLACGGSFLRVHGLPRGRTFSSVRVELDGVTARVQGGLVRLESQPGAPVLPVADIKAWHSILGTTEMGDPLLRVEGQETVEGLRDRIRWEGKSVAYHNVDVYRRDESQQPGSVPLRFRRSDWETLVAPKDETPFHGEVAFASPWDDSLPIWETVSGHFRQDEDSPLFSIGADVSVIPAPPELGGVE